MKKNWLVAFLLLTLILFSFGCKSKKSASLMDIDPVALSPELEWAVVISPYVAFRKDAGFDNLVTNHGRRGDVFLVKGKKSLREEITEESDSKKTQTTVRYVTWYLFDEGWLEETSLSIYDNRLRAENVASKLK